MVHVRRRRPSLMPAVALAALSALIAIPALSESRLYAAAPQHSSTHVVTRGENMWTIAEHYTPAGANVQDTIDDILAFNELRSAKLVPGQRLRIPR